MALVFAVIVAFALDLLVFRRLGAMESQLKEVAVQVAGGNYEVALTVPKRNDEIGASRGRTTTSWES